MRHEEKKHRDHHKARVMSCFKFKKGNVHGEEKERENDREKASERERERERLRTAIYVVLCP